MSSKQKGVIRCLDPETIIPISRGSTEQFKTGTWSRVRPVFLEKTSPCRAGCPVGNDIPRALYLASEGDYDGALAIFLQESALPGVCGRVCYHPCQAPCNRVELDGAVQIRALERAAADLGTAQPCPLTDAGRGKPVAVVGSGPAGLAAAYHLARMGHPVTVLEADERPGGLLARGIPQFRLPAEVLQKDLDRILSLPIDVKCNRPVDENALKKLRAENQALFLALGADHHQALGLDGEGLSGVLPGLPFLRRSDFQAQARGAHVVVFGGGNTAMDSARTALRSAAAEVTLVYRRSRKEMPALEDEVAEAEEEGVAFRFLAAPMAFIGQGGRLVGVRLMEMTLGMAGLDGRAKPIPLKNSRTDIDCELVIVATGQAVEPVPILNELRWEEGRIWTDESGLTSKSGIFAGGDLTPTRASVVDAMSSGKRAALAIHLALVAEADPESLLDVSLGQGPAFCMEAFFKTVPHWDPHHVVLLDELDRITSPSMPPASLPQRDPAERAQSFDEVSFSLNADQASKEANRCYFCGTCVGCDRCYIFCPEGAVVPPVDEDGTYDAHNDYCKGCGTC
ncbi:MAG: FAD-dependent oxidoreductase, partial [Nitrospiraceae bacterium]